MIIRIIGELKRIIARIAAEMEVRSMTGHGAEGATKHAVPRPPGGYAKASTGGQAHMRLRSP